MQHDQTFKRKQKYHSWRRHNARPDSCHQPNQYRSKPRLAHANHATSQQCNSQKTNDRVGRRLHCQHRSAMDPDTSPPHVQIQRRTSGAPFSPYFSPKCNPSLSVCCIASRNCKSLRTSPHPCQSPCIPPLRLAAQPPWQGACCTPCSALPGFLLSFTLRNRCRRRCPIADDVLVEEADKRFR